MPTLYPAPLRDSISAPYPLPNTATARMGFGQLWDFATSLLGTTGDPVDARAALGISDPLTVFRNRFINAAFAFNQRGLHQMLGNQGFSDPGNYLVDRWYGYKSGSGYTFAAGKPVAGVLTPLNYQIESGSAATTLGFGQRIAAAHCFDLAGQVASFSVDLAHTLSTPVTWTAWYANTTDSFGTVTSPTHTLIATGTFTVGTSLGRHSAQIAIPGAATTGIEIALSVAGLGTLTVGRPQFERGAMATEFEAARPLALELQLCRERFEMSRSIGVGSGQDTSVSEQFVATTQTSVAVGQYMAYVRFQVPKAYTPTIYTGPKDSYSDGYTGVSNSSAGVKFAADSAKVVGPSSKGFSVYNGSVGSIAATNGAVFFHWKAECEL